METTVHRQHIRDILAAYAATWAAGRLPYPGYSAAEERAILARFDDLVARRPRCFERDEYDPGHITGSALVVSPRFDAVLLTLHGKLNLWLQLGGHADGHPEPHAAALREAEEESGTSGLTFLAYERLFPELAGRLEVPLPFDFDVHAIPARRDAPAHYHYDVRYVILGDPQRPLAISDESHDLRWFPLEEARRLTSERSMQRQFDKLEALAAALGGGARPR
jgi:8-oxo-dGTP pyrophosphatase MutT (NUDIX family)